MNIDDNFYKYKVGIVLVNYNGAHDTIDCVNSIKESSYINYKVYVVDNGSNNADKQLLEKIKKDVNLIESNKNLGFSGGNNYGISFAIEDECDYILLLNNDTIIEKNMLNHMINTIQKHSDVGVLGCRIHYFNDKNSVWFAGGKIVDFMGTTRHCMKVKSGFEYVSFVTGCCMLIPREVIQNCGGLSERYFLYYEDADFCKKIVRNGWRLAVDLDAVIYHKVSSSTKEYSDNYFYYMIRNRFLFIKNNINGIDKIIAYVYSNISLVYKFIKYRKKSIAIGLWDFLRKKEGEK